MWRTLAEWMMAFFGMARELQEQRSCIRELEMRVRDLEEAIRLIAQEARHARETEAIEREKLLLQIERAVKDAPRSLPPPRRKKGP